MGWVDPVGRSAVSISDALGYVSGSGLAGAAAEQPGYRAVRHVGGVGRVPATLLLGERGEGDWVNWGRSELGLRCSSVLAQDLFDALNRPDSEPDGTLNGVPLPDDWDRMDNEARMGWIRDTVGAHDPGLIAGWGQDLRGAFGAVTWESVLDAISLIPVVGDIVDGIRAVVELCHGNLGEAGLMAAGLLPLFWSSGGAHALRNSIEEIVQGGLRRADDVADLGRTGRRGVRAGEQALETATRLDETTDVARGANRIDEGVGGARSHSRVASPCLPPTASRPCVWPIASSWSPTARVLEHGSHDQPVANVGLYAELYELQAAGCH